MSDSSSPDHGGDAAIGTVSPLQQQEHHWPEKITELTKHCIVHATMVLAPRGVKLPSGSHRIEQFCQELLTCVTGNGSGSSSASASKKGKQKKKPPQLPITSLIPELEVLNFYEGVSSYEEFATIVCSHITQVASEEEELNQSKIHHICWEYYSEYYKADIAYPKWLSLVDMYNLWLIFCSHLSSLSVILDSDIMNDILQRIIIKASFTWNESFEYDSNESLDYRNFLRTLVDRFTTLQVNSGVITEIVNDLKDEIVHGVLRKGYLFKKGHQVRNWKRRFFVLTRNSLTYFESREKMIEKGMLVINSHTHTEEMEDKGDKRHKFLVTCGSTGTEYVMCADDSRTRNEWILDIAKAIQLEQALQHSTEHEITNSIASFYQLKYGTSMPNLKRIDSTIRHATVSSSPRVQCTIKKISTSTNLPQSDISPVSSTTSLPVDSSTRPLNITDSPTLVGNERESDEQFYEDMEGTGGMIPDEASDDDDEAYTYMFQGKPEGSQHLDKGSQHQDKGSQHLEDKGSEHEDKESQHQEKRSEPGNNLLSSKSMRRAVQLSLSVLGPDKAAMYAEGEDQAAVNDINEDESTKRTDSALYEECIISMPRYVPSSLAPGQAVNSLEDSHDSNFENISELLKVSLASQQQQQKEEEPAPPTSNYMSVLPDHHHPKVKKRSSLESPTKTSPSRKNKTTSSIIVTPPTSPIRTDSDIYYITPPPVPAHRMKSTGTTP